MTPVRRRLDAELVRRGIVDSRQQAAAAVAAHRVLVGGAAATKASRMVSVADPLVLLGPGPRFVSRGGEKLDAALERFGIGVEGRRAVDAGASTGGFVDCLLQRGASRVVAIDAGRGQLDARLRADPRVALHEGFNVRSAGPALLGADGPADLLTADLSFISLRTVAPALAGMVRAGGDLVVLVKPQFEAGRADASRHKGVIKDPLVWRRTLLEVASALEAAGTGIMGAMASPIRGSAGNVEFFLHAVTGATPAAGLEGLTDAAVESVAEEA
ncbi:MAG: TlyA family RNA methyltransferase [Acidimicrobiales bacterium]